MRTHGLWTLFLMVAAGNTAIVYAATAAETGSTIEVQRQIFRDIYPAVERGDWKPVAAHKSLLADYPLWPDLRAAYLRSRLKKGDDTEVEAFLAQYGMLKPARELRYRFALRLAAKGNHDAFLSLYTQFYQDLEYAALDCLALAAEIAIGQTDSVAKRAERLWLVGNSQAEECDPVFAYLLNAGHMDIEWYRRRFVLARKQGQFSLARYIARSIDEEHVAEATQWLAAQRNSAQFIEKSDPDSSDASYPLQLVYALKNLAHRDPLVARKHWMAIRPTNRFSEDQNVDLDRHFALWAARTNLAEAGKWLDDLAKASINDEVLRWRIRTALRTGAWQYVGTNIDQLSPDEKDREEWQYWKAVALRQTGHTQGADQILAPLAEQRSYYGFLAADQLGARYALAQVDTAYNAEVVEKLSGLPTLIRARELYYVGLEGRGRSEWDAVMRTLDIQQVRQAALLAHEWGWHSRAIATAAMSGDFDDLELRYPLPHRKSFVEFSSDAKIRESWAYGVARSESLFMRDIRSSAGAIGVMQLLPETGQRTAREINYPYHGRNTLTDPASNIRLGTFYLGKMYQRFDENPALATAAYNAGPLRVDRWLPALGALDARIWIENIPYDETRTYVRRVLTSDAIFHWRLTGEMQRFSSKLVDIRAASRSPQISVR